MYIWAELLCEGDRNKRIKLDAQKWSLEKFLRKAAKQAIWIAIALITAITFVGYFTPVRDLAIDFFTFQLDLTAVFLGVVLCRCYLWQCGFYARASV